jgi:hypothetical protein
MSGMRIYVKKLTGELIPLDVESTDTTAEIKQKIRTKDGTAECDQRLIKGGQQLEDNRTLADYNVQKDSVLYLVLKTRGS